MSPAGGVGINLAIQDAVAAANLLTQPLLEGRVNESVLAAVQRRREFPTRVTQAVQIFAHRGFAAAFKNPGPIQAPWQLKVVTQIPGIHRALGRAVGMGARPEHVAANVTSRPRPSRLGMLLLAGIGVAATTAAIAWQLRSARHRAPAN